LPPNAWFRRWEIAAGAAKKECEAPVIFQQKQAKRDGGGVLRKLDVLSPVTSGPSLLETKAAPEQQEPLLISRC